MVRSALVIAVGAALACGTISASEDDLPRREANPFSAKTTEIDFEVDYVEGAAPYTGMLGGSIDIWDITRENLRTLLPGRSIRVPFDLSEMQPVPSPGKQAYSAQDILEMAWEHWDRPPSSGLARYYVIWLDGWFEERDGEVNTKVLGVSLSDRHVLGMFKPVIAAADVHRRSNVTAFVEQSTLVHEFGHAIGLVGLGLDQTSAHSDERHRAHCENPHCVMYHLNEGPRGLRDFVIDFVETGEMGLFDDACLADVAAALE